MIWSILYVHPRSSRITLNVAMEAMPYFHSATEFFFGDKTISIFRVLINDMAPMKIVLGMLLVRDIFVLK